MLLALVGLCRVRAGIPAYVEMCILFLPPSSVSPKVQDTARALLIALYDDVLQMTRRLKRFTYQSSNISLVPLPLSRADSPLPCPM